MLEQNAGTTMGHIYTGTFAAVVMPTEFKKRAVNETKLGAGV